MMRSLRTRAIFSGIGLSVLSILMGLVVLVTTVDETALRRFDADLSERHLQLVVAMVNSGLDAGTIGEAMTDPLYDRPYSGHYWQISAEDGLLLTSRSLFEAALDLPSAAPELRYFYGSGPDGPLRLAQRQITPEGQSPLVVAVAHSLAELNAERFDIRKSLLTGFASVGLMGLMIAIFQTSAALRPLTALRADIIHRWDNGETLEPDNYPSEVAPLVRDINILLARNRDIIDRSRRQGADLAHALKTPSAILRNELARIGKQIENTEIATDALDRIDAQIARSLARLRTANLAATSSTGTRLEMSALRLFRLFASIPDPKKPTLNIRVPARIRVAMDAQDLEEVLGNLLDNAMRMCRSQVDLSAVQADGKTLIVIEDDGPGISEADRELALRPGGQLDTATQGSGLGLAIASDLIEAYGGSLSLSTSAVLGGLRVEITVPDRHGL